MHDDVVVSIEVTTLTLLDSRAVPEPIEGKRVNLLRSNGSNTGVKDYADVDGYVRFEILPRVAHKFRVYFSGGTTVTDELPAAGSTTVATVTTSLTLLDSSGENGIQNKRVDLLRHNGSNTGVRVNTDENGFATFEVLNDFQHKFKVHLNGGTEVTAVVRTGEEDETVQAGLSTVTYNGVAQNDVRVDLLRNNKSNTGQRLYTDENGQASFEVLPSLVHHFRGRVQNSWESTTDPVTGGNPATIAVTGPPATKLVAAKQAVVDEWGEAYEFGLSQNNPNPFNPATAIRYTLAEESNVSLVVYNTPGQQVRVLTNNVEHAGQHAVLWDGRDEVGRTVATGTYIYRLVAGRNVATKKMVFAK